MSAFLYRFSITVKGEHIFSGFVQYLQYVKKYNGIIKKGKKVKFSRYRPSVAQRMGRGIALLFHDCSTRKGCVQWHY